MTPNEIIAAYITDLPPAIRPDVCFLLLGYLSDRYIDADTDLEKETLELVCPQDSACRVRAALCVSAVLDYLFAAHWEQNDARKIIEQLEKLAERTGDEKWRTAALRQPLHAKYREAACQK
jgi:hypothetical protein